MSSYNRVIIAGNLTRDVELRYLPSGAAVTDIGLAINDRRKDQSGQWIEDTTFVDVSMFGKTAEIAAEYLRKGSSVLIEGRLKLDTWEKDGKRQQRLKVVCERMQMLGGKGGDRNERTEEPRELPRSEPRNAPPVDDDSGIPF